MKYRVLRGGPARRFVFERRPASPALAAAPQKPLRAADLDNPYWRCYGAPRTREDLKKLKP